MRKSRKILSGIMAVCLMGIVAVIPENIAPAMSMTASAEDTVTWNYDDDTCVLTISGTGEMPGTSLFKDVPWQSEKKYIEEVIIEDGITTIGSSAFSNCVHLKKVTIPDSVISIKQSAFKGCTKLTSVTLPANLKSLGGHVFRDCEKLTSIELPESLIEMGIYNFSGCTALESASLPSEITTIPDYTFNGCTSLENVSFSDNITKIGEYAFYGCESLKNITLPDTLNEIGAFAFTGCKSFTEFNMPDSVKKINSSIFKNCISLESVRLSEKLVEVTFEMFRGCKSLTDITLPAKIDTIAVNPFLECKNLEKITILNPECEVNEFGYLGADKEKTVIYGYSGSTVQAYAEKYGYNFVALDGEPNTSATLPESTMTGDANGDNEVNISDAVLIMQSISNPSEYQVSESAKLFADVVDKGDGLTGMDALAIQMIEAKLITTDDLPITSEELNSLIK